MVTTTVDVMRLVLIELVSVTVLTSATMMDIVIFVEFSTHMGLRVALVVFVVLISMGDLVGCLFVSIGVGDLMRDSFLMVIIFMMLVMRDFMVGMFSL